MSGRLKTSIEGLDNILDGGFLTHNSILVKGEPGAGKTTLGIQMIINGIKNCEDNGIIVLFEQFPQQLYRDAMSYNWDLEKLIEEKKLAVLFLPASDIRTSKNMEESPLINKIAQKVMEIDAKRILVDGITHFIKMLGDEVDEREVFIKFLNAVKSLGLTPILTAEGSRDFEKEIGFEDFLSDCVIHLSSSFGKETTFTYRYLEVNKTRGHQHIRGKHPYRITNKGIEVYPNYRSRSNSETRVLNNKLERAITGIQGLDEMLKGGLTRGTSTILAGMPGAFKTTLGVKFISEGAANDEPGLIISFNERPSFLVKTMESKGIELSKYIEDKKIIIEHYVPKGFYFEELMLIVEELIKKHGIKRLLLDGISGIRSSFEDNEKYVDYFRKLLNLFNRYSLTSIIIQKLEKFTANQPLSDIEFAEIIDGVIYTESIEIESAVTHVISVLKMRGSSYLSDLRELTCDEEGLQVRDKLVGMSGILGGNPVGHQKKTIEEIFQPLYFIRDFLIMAGDPDTPQEQRQAITNNLNNEVYKVIEKLNKYFDISEEV